jgi:hypothetical protein
MTAWKDLERRVCAEMGGRRGGPVGAAVSDCVGVPFSVEVKRCKSQSVQTRFIEQAKAQSKREGKPWLVVVGGHNDRNPTATLDWRLLVDICRKAGVIAAPLEAKDEK